MGIPFFWQFIKEKFPNAVFHFHSRTKLRNSFDYFYIDSNPIIHGCCQEVFNYGAKKRLLNPYENMSMQEKLTKIFELFFDNIICLVNIIKPQKMLYIALDGPAPKAKQAQQRQRRFMAAKSGHTESVLMTPGTDFMHELSKFMYWRIRKQMQNITNNYSWSNIEVIFSSINVPGEGEHKLTSYIRNLPLEEQNNAKHCMFGPDNDLLMLILSSHVKFISLLREDLNEPDQYDLVNAHYIRQGLITELGQSEGLRAKKRTIHDIANDFVFLGFFVGNDFLPKIKMFYKLSDGLQKMFTTYIITSNNGTSNYLTKDNKILIEGLQNFISYLSLYEQTYISELANIVHKDSKFLDHTLLQHAIIEDVIIMDRISRRITSFDMEKYRISYYQKVGIVGGCSENCLTYLEMKVEEMCRDYIQNLGWVYQYYTSGLPCWNVSYKYHYAPLMKDLCKYVNKLSQTSLDELLTFELQEPALPFEQLLAILPASLAHLLPEEYRYLMTDNESPLVQAGYYPETFDIDYEGKIKDYEGITILPFVDYKVVSEVFKQTESENEKLYHKNIFGNDYLFKLSSIKNVTFKSEYGIIENCKVNVLKL